MIDSALAAVPNLLAVIDFPKIDPVIFSVDLPFIGELALRWYSVGYLVGIIFAWWYIRRLCERPGAAMSKDHIDDLMFWVTIGIIAGGRLGYVFFYGEGKFWDDPLSIIGISENGIALQGMSFHGGLTGVVLAIIFFARKHKLELLRVADLGAITSPIGLFLVRIANFINGELWGRPTDVSWAMIFPDDPTGLPRHPSQLYEAFAEGLILFLIMQFLYHRTRLAKDNPGVIAGLFFIGYAIARILIEFVRQPDSHLKNELVDFLGVGISRGQMLSVPMFMLAAWLIHRGLNYKKSGKRKKAKA
jgi:phosphatidylglycerol:prolipoprotein diacylglycerol transferase